MKDKIVDQAAWFKNTLDLLQHYAPYKKTLLFEIASPLRGSQWA